MADSKEVRWKGRHASETALSSPMSGIYNAIKEVLDTSEWDLCRSLRPVTHEPAYPPPIPGFDNLEAKDGMQLFQLGLEEAFFLSHEYEILKLLRYKNSHFVPQVVGSQYRKVNFSFRKMNEKLGNA
ncbi:hypothetical protein R1sor_008339 [Riccia sorocarpa]|uniref:Uncharacterized protein n=1 Tax=Riccia sorocarpa TaxID=122646 RepID=A0ABD3HTH3_9MARC